jgi:hypothetical protein
MSTQDIIKAFNHLEASTLKAAVKQVHGKESSSNDKKELVEEYQNAVLDAGLENFAKKLSPEDLKTSCSSLGLEVNEDSKKNIKTIEEGLLGTGINGLIAKADEKLLKKYCETLGLEKADKESMIKEIADEVMLTGMETFLQLLTTPVLRSHCEELKLNSTGNKKELVERLMVHIFELEPLNETKDDSKEKTTNKEKPTKKVPTKKKDSSKKEKESKKSKDSKKESKKEKSPSRKEKSPSRKASPKRKRDEESEEEGRSKKKPKAKPKEKTSTEPKKREKFVAPPITTIGKKYTTYVDLFDNFNLPDLINYCKEGKLKVSGKKKDVINRILLHLSGEVETKKTKKRKAKSGGPVVPKRKKVAAKVKDGKEKKEKDTESVAPKGGEPK